MMSETAPRESRHTWFSRVLIFQLAIAVLTIVISILVAFKIAPLIKRKAQLEAELIKTTQDLDKLKVELEEKRRALDEAGRTLGMSSQEVAFLKNYGFLSGTENLADLRNLVEQSRLAKDEVQKIKSTTAEKDRRAGISIRYFPRRTDQGRVEAAMEALNKDYGFKPVRGEQKEPNTPTNAIWLARENLTEEDVKLIAYYLILFGNEIRYIGPATSTPAAVRGATESAFLVAEPKVITNPPLPVEEIRNLSLSALRSGVKGSIASQRRAS